MKLLDIHWGWATPGLGGFNRQRQFDLYMDILDRRDLAEDYFCFTQPGWVLDIEQFGPVKALTVDSPEPGNNGVPMMLKKGVRFQVAVSAAKYSTSPTLIQPDGQSGYTMTAKCYQ